MPAIQVRDVPDPIYRKRAEMAEKEHRSLAQQTLAVLARGLNLEVDFKTRRKNILAELRGPSKSGRTLSDPAKI